MGTCFHPVPRPLYISSRSRCPGKSGSLLGFTCHLRACQGMRYSLCPGTSPRLACIPMAPCGGHALSSATTTHSHRHHTRGGLVTAEGPTPCVPMHQN